MAARRRGVFGEVSGLALSGEIRVVGLGVRLAEIRVGLVVPLADPEHDLEEPGQQAHQTVRAPSVGGGAGPRPKK